MQTMGRRFMDNELQKYTKLMDEVIDMHGEEMNGNWEHEEKLDLTDHWMGKRNRMFRKILDWWLVEDGHGETHEKRKWCRDMVVHTGDGECSEECWTRMKDEMMFCEIVRNASSM